MNIALLVEIPVALLLLLSGILTLTASIGLLGLPSFFQRMHPPALTSTLSTWCVALATILYLSAETPGLRLYPWIVVVLLSITAPFTALFLSRAALFRSRQINLPGIPETLTKQAAHQSEDSEAQGENL